MNQVEIANAYEAAHRIVTNARIASIHLHPAWDKLSRIGDYINKAATEQLAEVLA